MSVPAGTVTPAVEMVPRTVALPVCARAGMAASSMPPSKPAAQRWRASRLGLLRGLRVFMVICLRVVVLCGLNGNSGAGRAAGAAHDELHGHDRGADVGAVFFEGVGQG